MLGTGIINMMQDIAKPSPSDTTDLVIGQVTSIKPLKIRVDDRYDLDERFLLLSTLVRDFEVDMTVDHMTEKVSGGGGDSAYAAHDHPYVGRKTFLVHLGLVVGEKVMLLRVQSGQKFIVLDRLR